MKQVCFRKTTNEHESHCTLGHKLVPSAIIKTNFRIKTAFIPLFLFAALLLSVSTVQAQSSGNVNENITWMFADGTLTLSGTGTMPNYSSLSDVPWYNNYSLAITKVEIGAGITTIGSYAFGDLPYLTSVTIPNGITSIGEYAFQGCNNLTTITLPEDLLTIGGYAFYGCTALTSITIPGSVTSIGMWAFGLCISLPSITLPEGLLTIGDGAFDYCSQLVSLNIPPNITNIGFGTFAECSKLASITLPEGVVTVGNFAFQRCSALATIRVLSATPPAAGNLAFNLLDRASCKLIVPSGAKAAYQAAPYWQGFTNILEVTAGTTGPLSWILISDGTFVISGKGDMPDYGTYPFDPPWYNYRSAIKTVVIEEGVTSIGSWAFNEAQALTQVSIPSSVTSIGDYAFCSNAITSVTIPAGVTRIEVGVFSECTKLTSITFLGNITSIGLGAFSRTGFTSFTIPSGVTAIGWYAFQYCSQLTSITFPNSVTSIGNQAFWFCSALTTVRILTLTPPYLNKSDVFYLIDPACVLEVPSESYNLYTTAHGWDAFTTINEIVDPDLASSVVSASIASSTSITINGTITNSSSEAKNSAGYYCAYGTDPNNLNQNTATQYGTVPASGSLNVSTTISGLTNGTLYYYKLVAVGNRSAPGKIFLSNPIPTSNLKLWLRADMAVTSASSAVSAWGDVSGWNNDASQGTSGNQPTVAEGAINAKPALSFNGTTSKLTLPTSTSLGLQSTPYEMFIVAKSSSSDIQFLIAGGATEQFEYHLNGAVGARFIPVTSIFVDQGTAGAYTNGSAHVFSARTSASAGVVRIDGNDVGASGVNTLSSNSGNLLLGGRSDNMYYLNGSIAEVIIYNTNLSNEERNAVEQYLADRYNISQSTFQTEGNWSVASNWSNGLPGPLTAVTLAANCTVDGNYSAGDVSVNSSVAVTVGSGNTLSVGGNLTLKSDASNTASLINNGTINVSGTTTVERYMASGGWHLIASPVTGQSIGSFLSASNTIASNPSAPTNKAMKDYNETTNNWNGLTYYTTTTDEMVANKGYSVWPSTDGLASFTGTLQSGSKDVSVVKAGYGWNCIGNPYTSAIASNSGASASNNFIDLNMSKFASSYEAIYVWQQSPYGYVPINHSYTGGAYYIPVGQAFFVRTASAGNFSFTPAMQSHQNGAMFKSALVEPATIAIVAEQNSKQSLATIKFIDNCTNGLDVGYDAGAMKTGFDVFTRLVNDNGVDFALQCLPESGGEEYSIPVGIETTEAGKLTLKFSTTNVAANYKLMLEDRMNGTSRTISSNTTVTVDVAAGTTLGRFYLSMANTTSAKIPGTTKALVSQLDGKIIVSGISGNEASATLYDVQGRRISHTKLNRDSSNEISTLGLINGIYLLKIDDQGKVQTKRIAVKN